MSVHVNEGARTGAAGIETFYFSESGHRLLASLVQRQIVTNANTGGNRSIDFERFRVLRMSTKPAILVETGIRLGTRETGSGFAILRTREAVAQGTGLGLLQIPSFRASRLSRASRCGRSEAAAIRGGQTQDSLIEEAGAEHL